MDTDSLFTSNGSASAIFWQQHMILGRKWLDGLAGTTVVHMLLAAVGCVWLEGTTMLVSYQTVQNAARWCSTDS